MSTIRKRIPASMLKDGDKITASQRYGRRVRGPAKVRSASGNLVFLEAPTLPDEDVAFQAREWVEVDREVTPGEEAPCRA